jgi:hypothetical protein
MSALPSKADSFAAIDLGRHWIWKANACGDLATALLAAPVRFASAFSVLPA